MHGTGNPVMVITIHSPFRFGKNWCHGKRAMAACLDYFRSRYDADRIVLGHRPDYVAAAALYEKTGFRETGEMIGGEVIRCYAFA